MVLRVNEATGNYVAYSSINSAVFISGTADIYIYTGTQPATVGGGHADTLLVQVYMTGSWGAGASKKTIHDLSNAYGTAVATGTAGWARMKYNGITHMDVDISGGGGGGTLEIDNTTITNTDTVNVTAFSFIVDN